MARLLEELPAPVAPGEGEDSASSGRSTARALATAIALLMISLLVVTRSQAAFEANPADADTSFASGDVRLSDDDRGTTLFDIPDMVPGRPVSDCILVTYEGNVVPVVIGLEADVDGALAPALQLTIESGSGGSFHRCGEFAPDEVVYRGSLSELADRGGPVRVFEPDETPAARTFRFTFELDDDVPVRGHATANADFTWNADT